MFSERRMFGNPALDAAYLNWAATFMDHYDPDEWLSSAFTRDLLVLLNRAGLLADAEKLHLEPTHRFYNQEVIAPVEYVLHAHAYFASLPEPPFGEEKPSELDLCNATLDLLIKSSHWADPVLLTEAARYATWVHGNLIGISPDAETGIEDLRAHEGTDPLAGSAGQSILRMARKNPQLYVELARDTREWGDVGTMLVAVGLGDAHALVYQPD